MKCAVAGFHKNKLKANSLFRYRPKPPYSVLLLFGVVAFAPGQARQQVADKSAQSASASVASAPSSDVSRYVGAETCKTCHEKIYNASIAAVVVVIRCSRSSQDYAPKRQQGSFGHATMAVSGLSNFAIYEDAAPSASMCSRRTTGTSTARSSFCTPTMSSPWLHPASFSITEFTPLTGRRPGRRSPARK